VNPQGWFEIVDIARPERRTVQFVFEAICPFGDSLPKLDVSQFLPRVLWVFWPPESADHCGCGCPGLHFRVTQESHVEWSALLGQPTGVFACEHNGRVIE
jgi:hypothetical protein